MFDDKIKEQLKGILSQLGEAVNILYFTQETECGTCADTHTFLKELTDLSDKLKLTAYDLVKDKDKAKSVKVDKIPAIVILDKDNNNTGIRFFGLPGGYEINSFINSLLEVSGKKEELPEELLKRITGIKKNIHIQVFVSLTCPYCPGAVSAAHRMALENKKISADMVEGSTFQELAIKYKVSSVPKIIINENFEFIGAKPIAEFIDEVEKAVAK